MALTFEIKSLAGEAQDKELEVSCDREGLDSLVAQLLLLQAGKTDHVHLMSGSWGGNHLEDAPREPTNAIVRHVKITLSGD